MTVEPEGHPGEHELIAVDRAGFVECPDITYDCEAAKEGVHGADCKPHAYDMDRGQPGAHVELVADSIKCHEKEDLQHDGQNHCDGVVENASSLLGVRDVDVARTNWITTH